MSTVMPHRIGSRVMRSRSAAAPLLVVAAAVALTVTLMRPGPAAGQPGAEGNGGVGRSLYLRDCAACHGAAAMGTHSGPSLQGVGRAAVDYWVSTGRMPLVGNGRDPASPYGQTPPGQLLANPTARPHRHRAAYSPDVVADIEDYVASITGPGPDIPTVDVASADLAAGGERFREQCAACHSWDGTGGALYQREAPSLHRATPTQIAEAIRIGPGEMPAFGPSAIRPDQLADVVAYVRYLDHPNDRGGFSLWHLGPVAEGGVAIVGGLGILLAAIRWIGERT